MSDDGPKTRTRGKRPVTEEPKPVKKQPKPKTVYDVSQLQDIAHQLRIYSIQMTIASNSGHPTSCASMAEIMSVLFFTKAGMHYNPKDPKNFGNDRFVLSKGHAAPILYAAWAIAGFVDPAELLKLRKFDSDLEGHPTPKLPFVDVATGSLGQGLSVAGGMAYSSKYLDKIDNRYWVVIGDGECAEGSIWEAAHLASYYKLDNLTAILDINRLGQSQETSIGHDIEVYKKRFEAFGWSVIKVDGHNITALAEAMEKCRNTKNQPQIILAKTFKGKYIEKIENELDWHGKPVPATTIEHLKSLQKSKTLQFDLTPEVPESREWPERHHFTLATEYAADGKQSTRKAYGKALVALSKDDVNHQIVAVDGDTKNSTFAQTYKDAIPTNFVECFIAEQNMVGWAQGLACRGKVAFASAFAAFFSRAYDQIRMGGVSGTEMKYVGSHAGVSIGEDGPSQMGLEDISMFRSIPGSVVLYPSDGVSAERAIELVANHKGICYVRTSRPDLSILYTNEEKFEIGKGKCLREGNDIVIVGGGVTTHEAMKAAKELQDVSACVIDIFSVKPLDKELLLESALKSKSKIILTVEDHYEQGGLFESIASALAGNPEVKVIGVFVTKVARSGTPNELLSHFHLDGASIAKKVRELMN